MAAASRPVAGNRSSVFELVGGRARVVLVSPDGDRRALTGPWPQQLELEPGRYTLLAHRRGHQPFTHHVELTTERPDQQVVVELELDDLAAQTVRISEGDSSRARHLGPASAG